MGARAVALSMDWARACKACSPYRTLCSNFLVSWTQFICQLGITRVRQIRHHKACKTRIFCWLFALPILSPDQQLDLLCTYLINSMLRATADIRTGEYAMSAMYAPRAFNYLSNTLIYFPSVEKKKKKKSTCSVALSAHSSFIPFINKAFFHPYCVLRY